MASVPFRLSQSVRYPENRRRARLRVTAPAWSDLRILMSCIAAVEVRGKRRSGLAILGRQEP